MNFSDLCNVLETVKNSKGHTEKKKHITAFIKTLRDGQHELFPVIRLLVPKLDRDRISYRIKEAKISKLLIKMLGLPQGNEATLLTKSASGSNIDFGDVVYSVLKKYIVNKETGLTIIDINNYLDKIANRTTDKGLDDLILEIFRKLSPKNIKWLIQIIVKDLKLGFGDNSILNCLHEDGANFYATNNNLMKLCEVLSDPDVKLHELEIKVFSVFRPMLSKRCDARNFKKCFPDGKSFFIENKFDGERFQLHMEEGKFKYFSRNGFDYTDSYGASHDEGELTPRIKNVFDPELKKVILDGEMMIWNKKTQSFGSKGMNLDVKKLGPGKYQSCFCVFDILLCNDKVLTNQPLHKRLQVLREVIKKTVVGSIIISAYSEANSVSDIVDMLNSSVDNNEEGIVVKDPKSIYKYNDRNSGWFKIKMEYFDDVVHDLDVMVMGGFFGAASKLSSLMVGVSSGTDTYLSFGRISSGLNDEQIDVLSDKLKLQGVDFKHFSTKTQGKLQFGRETPDIYIEPHNSLVLQIRATELIRSTNDVVKCPYTLRFPRVLKIRDDKPVDECLSLNEMLELTSTNKSVIKLNKRHIDLEEIVNKVRQAKKIKVEVVNLDQPHGDGDFLMGKRFYVESGTDRWGTEEISHTIKKSGGDIYYHFDSNVDVVLVGKITPKVSNMMKNSNNFDIIHVDWLRRVLELGQLVDYNSEEIFYLGDNYRRELSTNLDKFGDSFTVKATEESLGSVLRIMKGTDVFLNTNDAVSLTDGLFGQYLAYFDSFEEINNPDSKQIYYSLPDEVEFQLYRGRISKEIAPGVNLVITEENSDERRSLICKFLKNNGIKEVEIADRNFICQKTSRS